MLVLQLSKKFPFPAIDGESIAVQSLCGGLVELGAEIDLLVMSTPKHPVDVAAIAAHETNFYRHIYSVAVNTDLRVFDAFANLFTNKSYNINRFVSTDYTEKLIQLLTNNDYDIIQLETLYLSPYAPIVRRYSRAKVVLRSHNLEYEIWERLAQNERFLPKRKYLRLLTKRLKAFEIQSFAHYDLIAAITDRDGAQYRRLGYKNELQIIPIGINATKNEVTKNADFVPHFGFIGSLDWLPNVEAIDWFIPNVWLRFIAKQPSAQLFIAGRHLPKRWREAKWQNVHFIGEVPDAKAFIQAQPFFIAPLQAGGGLKVKVLEAMALGRVVVSTHVGLEGINASQGVAVWRADTPDEWLAALDKCVTKSTNNAAMAAAAQAYIEAHFSRQAIAAQAMEKYGELLL